MKLGKLLLTVGAGLLINMSLMAQAAPTSADLGLMKGFPAPEDKRVDAGNWILYPYNTWAFKNVQRLLPTTNIDNGSLEAIPFDKKINNLDDIEVNIAGEKLTVKNILETHHTDGIVVLHKGDLVYERFWNDMTATTPHWMASTSKSITGTLAAIYIERGVLDENALVKDIIPELATSGWGNATVRELLDMSVGTDWDESMSAIVNEQSFARQYAAAANSLQIKGYDGSGVMAFLPNIEKGRKHGESFLYNSPATDVMGWILNRITGNNLEHNVSIELWQYLGAMGQSNYLLDGAGIAWPTGGMSSGLYDLAKFGLLIQQEGMINGKRVFSSAIVKDIIENGNKEQFAKSPHADLYPNGHYRNFWWVKGDEDNSFMAKGIYGQYIYINPAKETVIVRFASEKESASQLRMKQVEAAFQQISDYLNK
ncbi:MAG: beta-lactamase family protein [Bacteroidales bacterium]|nr:beta-lactamase family protein [Bacteroidales bacterium]